ncbi:MAG: hypothetical protein PF485_12145 [Bacteroidales bacterium]|jgi:hypothetical protein|nr:hypothetical protein [Bacteroidales bacterium]
MKKYHFIIILFLFHFACKSEEIELDTISVKSIEINRVKIGANIESSLKELGASVKITLDDKKCIENCKPYTKNYWFSETSFISEAIVLAPSQLCAFRVWKDTTFIITINNRDFIIGDDLNKLKDELNELFPRSYKLAFQDSKKYYEKYNKRKKYFTLTLLLKDQADIFDSVKKEEESHPIVSSFTLRFEDNILNYISIDYYIE